jgi:arginine/lysine/ornithine decarboxylase
MLFLANAYARSEGRPFRIAAGRNAHKSFVGAAALLDAVVDWLVPAASTYLSCPLTSADVEAYLSDCAELPACVYVTSPDYLGNLSDIAGLSLVCRQYDIPLLVDNAHGAYLGFLGESMHPIALGATLCCDSAHKTLPVLTGGAYLHVGQSAPRGLCDKARKYLSLFASTSPSYLILQSLDLCNAYIENGYGERLSTCVERISQVKLALQARGFRVLESEPLKLVIDAKASGYTGEDIALHLKTAGIECEFADADYLVLMATPENSESDFERLQETFGAMPTGAWAGGAMPSIPQSSEIVLTPRQAILSPSEIVALDDALGRICAAPTVSCPPAVPIVISGERIGGEHIAAMKYYGHSTIEVVK